MATSVIPRIGPTINVHEHDITVGNIGPSAHKTFTDTIDCGDEIPIAVVGFNFTGTGSYSITSIRRLFTIDKTNHTIGVDIRVYTGVPSISVSNIHCYVYYLTSS